MEKTLNFVLNFVLTVILGVLVMIALTMIFQNTTVEINVGATIDQHIQEHNEMIEAQRETPYLSTVDY